jgi:hypothetical protein
MIALRHISPYRVCLTVLFTSMLVVMALGLWRSEGSLPDRAALLVLERAIQLKHLRIVQPTPLDKLRLEQIPFDSLPVLYYASLADSGVRLDQSQWRRVGQIADRLVAAENQAQAGVFTYEGNTNSGFYAIGFDQRRFEYENPFKHDRSESSRATLGGESSYRLSDWLVIGERMLVALREAAPQRQAVANVLNLNAPKACHVAQSAILTNGQDSLRMTIAARPARGGGAGRVQGSNLHIARTDGAGNWSQPLMLNSGEYFVFDEQTFTVHERSGQGGPGLRLMFSKRLNGRDVRVHVLGDATTNMLGVAGGGYSDGLDGAVLHGAATRIDLTIDPEFQFCTAALLAHELAKIDAASPLPRRRASATVLDAETGRVLAQVGLPAHPVKQSIERRRILVVLDQARKDPSTEVHMAGSTVKVLTVGLGYLLFGEARAELLPASNNDLAIQQAFHNAYGVSVGANTLTADGSISSAFHERFLEAGRPPRVTPEFVRTLRDVFVVSPVVNDASPRATGPEVEENLIPMNVRRFFDAKRAAENINPEISRLPLWDADTVGIFRNYALGEQDAKFTTLRLAAVLATVTNAQRVQPYIVSTVTDTAGTIYRGSLEATSDIQLPWLPNPDEHKRRMMAGMQLYLHRVLLPGGTGEFFMDNGAGSPVSHQYLGRDDPSTRNVAEDLTRAADLGKSGTADYGKYQKPQDSLFLYRHGRFVVAVWFERSDFGENTLPSELSVLRHPAHRFTHRLISWLEAGGRS